MSTDYPDMETYEITEFIRNLFVNNLIKVYFKKRHMDVQSIKLRVTDTGQNSTKPLITCWELDVENTNESSPTKKYNLESSTKQARYKIITVSGPQQINGSEIVAIGYV